MRTWENYKHMKMEYEKENMIDFILFHMFPYFN